MSVKVALNHQTIYRYDRQVSLGPHLVRLRPVCHWRSPIHHYSLKVHRPKHSLHWQQDPYGNFQARLTFFEKATELQLEVDLIAEILPTNPFDFLLEPYSAQYPFTYDDELAKELSPFLEILESGPLLQQWLASIDRQEQSTVNFIISLNQNLQQEIAYSIRLEPGIQSCEETLDKKIASCRDSSWLLVKSLRHCGLAARFVSGYLIELASSSDGDSAALHAWAEVYLPGAGWIGLDPTSGLLTASGHIPLACTANPHRASPVNGSTEICESQMEFSMTVSRL